MADEADKPRKLRKLSRRRFLKLLAGAGVAAVTATAIDVLAIEPRWIKVTRPSIPIKHLPAAWDGVRIALLADFHHGRLIRLGHVRKAVQMANDARPDVIAMVGDYVSSTSAITRDLAAALGKLRGPVGVFAVLGNHDYWTDASGVTAMLRSAGVELLTNRHRICRRDGQPLCFAGVDDLWAGRPNLASALAGVDEAIPRILLCHNPDYAERMPPTPRVDLMLCGHSHGGQVKLPFGPRPRLPIRHARYAAGLAAGPHSAVYTSVGLGMVGIPVRFNCRPELAILTLRRP